MVVVLGTIGIDAVIMGVAARRGGVCTRAELLAQGIGTAAISRRIATGLLRPTQRGVYLIEELATALTPLHHAIARVPGGELTRFTAGRLHDHPIGPTADPAIVDVATAHGFNHRIEGVALHRRRRSTSPHDLVVIDDLPVTGPAMTIVDLAAVVGPARLRHIVHTQITVGSPTVDELVACFEAVARRGVNGIAALRKVLESVVDDQAPVASALERALASLLRTSGIEGFQSQYRPPWFDGRRGSVDFAHPNLRIVLEADGRRWHRREQEMAEDRRRDRMAASHGWVTIRVTWHEVNARPAATADEIRSIVDRRALELRPVA